MVVLAHEVELRLGGAVAARAAVPPKRLITSLPPRVTIVVPVAVTSRVKNSQSFESGSNPGARLTIASWGMSWMMVPTG